MRRVGQIAQSPDALLERVLRGRSSRPVDDVNGDGKRFMPRNDLNEPNVGIGFGGAGDERSIAGGV